MNWSVYYFSLLTDDGRLKYKVSFEDKGTCLVSGHHIAFDSRPKVEQLYIGARVVVRCQNNKYRFRPGILAELPSRKNQFRCVILNKRKIQTICGFTFKNVTLVFVCLTRLFWFLGFWCSWMTIHQFMSGFLCFTWCADLVSSQQQILMFSGENKCFVTLSNTFSVFTYFRFLCKVLVWLVSSDFCFFFLIHEEYIAYCNIGVHNINIA